MHDSATLAHAIRTADPLFTRFLAGFDDDNRATPAEGLPNHASWTVGHVAVSMHRSADLVLGFNEPQHLPTDDWVHGDGTAGDPSRFDTESVCFGSTPVPNAAKYPRWKRSMEIYVRALDKLVDATRAASPNMMVREVKWGGSLMPAGDLIARQIVHLGTHAGQLADLRRALGVPPLFG